MKSLILKKNPSIFLSKIPFVRVIFPIILDRNTLVSNICKMIGNVGSRLILGRLTLLKGFCEQFKCLRFVTSPCRLHDHSGLR